MSLFGSIFDFLSGGNSSNAANAAQQGVDLFNNIKTPSTDKMKLQLDQMVQQGLISPEDAQVYIQSPSAMAGISTDPRLQQAQYDALSSLQDIGSSGGLTAMDKSKLAQIQRDEATQSRGARDAILQSMEARGAGGSGASLLAQLLNQQQSADRQSQRDLDVAGMAQQRALDALMNAGNLGGQMQSQSFNQQAQQAQAADAINRFNAANQNQIGLANTQARNQAQQQNLAEKQRIADTNVGLRNQQQQYNKELSQQNYENKLKKAAGQSGALGNQMQNYNQTAQGIQNLIGTGITAAALSDENEKEDIKDFDASQFLDSLTPHKYHYKNKANGEGSHAGVMAQDLEKTPEGSAMVEDTPEGKIVDYGKGFGTLAAAMGDLHDRLKKLEGGKA